MHTRTHSMLAAAALAAIMTASTIASAQAAASTAGKTSRGMAGTKDSTHMKGMPGMKGMMMGTHHVLAMAYRDNMATFARLLRSEVARTKAVDLELARTAATEMRRSLDQMGDQHRAHMKSMGDHPDPKTTEAAKHMDTRLALLGVHLSALDGEVNTRTPSAQIVSEHASEIVKECAGMSEMSGMGMPGKAKTGKGMTHKTP